MTIFHAWGGGGLLDGVVYKVTTVNENSGYRMVRVSKPECVFYLLYGDASWSEDANVAILVQAI